MSTNTHAYVFVNHVYTYHTHKHISSLAGRHRKEETYNHRHRWTVLGNKSSSLAVRCDHQAQHRSAINASANSARCNGFLSGKRLQTLR